MHLELFRTACAFSCYVWIDGMFRLCIRVLALVLAPVLLLSTQCANTCSVSALACGHSQQTGCPHHPSGKQPQSGMRCDHQAEFVNPEALAATVAASAPLMLAAASVPIRHLLPRESTLVDPHPEPGSGMPALIAVLRI